MIDSRILAVTTPAADTMLVSLDVAKDELGITDTTTDARITRWIREASSILAGRIGRTLRAETVLETFRPGVTRHDHFYERAYTHNHNGILALPLARYPIISVNTVTDDDTILVDGTDFETDRDAGIIYRLCGSTRTLWSGPLVSVAYSGGFATTDDVAPDLQAACLTLIKSRRDLQNRDPMLRGITVPGVLEQQYWRPGDAASLPPEVETIIARYRDICL